MGATKEEILENHMQNCINDYDVENGTHKYKLITEDVLAMLKFIAGTEDLDKADLAAASGSAAAAFSIKL